MMQCPCCKGVGWFHSHADGSLSEDCDICNGSGAVFDGMRMIKRLIRMPKYVIDCGHDCGLWLVPAITIQELKIRVERRIEIIDGFCGNCA
jgi:hypothetical protein